MTKIIGIGLNRTGTTTLCRCFEHLGYRHTSAHQQAFEMLQRGDMNKLMKIVSEYDSFEDWPWPLVYREIDKTFPDSKFILTKRKSADAWFASLCKLAELFGPTEYRRLIYGYAMPQEHKEEHVAFYNRHNQAVEDYFSNCPGKLLVVSWEDGDDWKVLCPFLGRDIPDLPFPHVNRSDRLAEIVRRNRGQ